ncbi:fibroblast growth factor 2 isoform X2 [Ranitomeya variabilis]|uniref:fibroblast growth factor 2 isoform X2 n=1 Tax=Ranitomeya variabilis TaxID=490064 RepID=UPI004056E00C
MAAGSITTLPPMPDDGGSTPFPPGNFKDPKRLYCKNGGFFLRINSDGKVDGSREKSDSHIKLQLQAEERGVVSIKGVSANRYLAMKDDGRLIALGIFHQEFHLNHVFQRFTWKRRCRRSGQSAG